MAQPAITFHTRVPDAVKQHVREQKALAQRQYPGKRPAAFLDLDGSLIEGDITEGKKGAEPAYLGLIDLAIMGGLIPGFSGAEGMRQFWQKYEKEFPRPEDAYLWASKLVANLPEQEHLTLKEFIIRHLGDMVERYAFAFTHDLLGFCEEEAIVPYIISASPHYFVEELGRFLPIEMSNIFGFNGKEHEGQLVDPMHHDAEGKEQRVRDLCASRPIYPLLALGNKWRWDGMMIRHTCESGGVGVLVNEERPSNFRHPRLHCFTIR